MTAKNLIKTINGYGYLKIFVNLVCLPVKIKLCALKKKG